MTLELYKGTTVLFVRHGKLGGSSAPGKGASNKIDLMLQELNEKDLMVTKLLLLGTGNSGKSTLLKQFKKVYSSGFSSREREEYVGNIRRNIINGMFILIKGAGDLEGNTGEYSSEGKAKADELIRIANENGKRLMGENAYVLDLLDLMGTMDIGGKSFPVKDVIWEVWNEPPVVYAFENRHLISGFEYAHDYYMTESNYKRIASSNYKPTDDDMLRARVRTVGIVETSLTVDDAEMVLVDVGGQRNQRSKWISHFDSVTAVLFVVDMAEYNKLLLEDGKTNRMHESLFLFNDMAKCPYFQESNFLLFLNKHDLFQEKIKTVDLNVCFPKYKKGCDYEAASKYIKKQYQKEFDNARGSGGDDEEGNHLHMHLTCATDSEAMVFVLKKVTEIILKATLESIGMM